VTKPYIQQDDTSTSFLFQYRVSDNIVKDSKEMTKAECPWCDLNCKTLQALSKHLQYCHPRFKINLHESDKFIPIIEISIAKSTMPEKVSKITKSMFKRTYYHHQTYLPMSDNEIQKPDVSDLQPKWAFQKQCKNIDDFTDLNEGEKQMMKIWSNFVSNMNIVGDCQVPKAIDLFIEKYGLDIMGKNLYRNFVLHLVNLNDFHVITPKVAFEAICKIKKMKINNSIEPTVISTETLEEPIQQLEPQTDSGLDSASPSQTEYNEEGLG